MTILWQSDCCHAPLDSYKDTECPECGAPCQALATDIEPPDDHDVTAPLEPLHRGRKDQDR